MWASTSGSTNVFPFLSTKTVLRACSALRCTLPEMLSGCIRVRRKPRRRCGRFGGRRPTECVVTSSSPGRLKGSAAATMRLRGRGIATCTKTRPPAPSGALSKHGGLTCYLGGGVDFDSKTVLNALFACDAERLRENRPHPLRAVSHEDRRQVLRREASCVVEQGGRRGLSAKTDDSQIQGRCREQGEGRPSPLDGRGPGRVSPTP